jgi:hypothetical protein
MQPGFYHGLLDWEMAERRPVRERE